MPPQPRWSGLSASWQTTPTSCRRSVPHPLYSLIEIISSPCLPVQSSFCMTDHLVTLHPETYIPYVTPDESRLCILSSYVCKKEELERGEDIHCLKRRFGWLVSDGQSAGERGTSSVQARLDRSHHRGRAVPDDIHPPSYQRGFEVSGPGSYGPSARSEGLPSDRRLHSPQGNTHHALPPHSLLGGETITPPTSSQILCLKNHHPA